MAPVGAYPKDEFPCGGPALLAAMLVGEYIIEIRDHAKDVHGELRANELTVSSGKKGVHWGRVLGRGGVRRGGSGSDLGCLGWIRESKFGCHASSGAQYARVGTKRCLGAWANTLRVLPQSGDAILDGLQWETDRNITSFRGPVHIFINFINS